MMIAVYGGNAKRWAFPFSGDNRDERGRLAVGVEGFVEGTANVVAFGGFGSGLAPDLVGFEVLE
jgi:alpha-galactosidase